LYPVFWLEHPKLTTMTSDFTVSSHERFFEDYVHGAVYEYGPVRVEEADIIEFAKKFDPQFFHIDPVAAASGPFGGLIASGWHTGSLMMRLLADHFISKAASLGSPGIDELRWLRPVRPRDLLRVRVSILEANRSRSKPDRGIVRTLVEVLNQNSEVVMSLKAVNLILCRSSQPPPAGSRE
jgi:acyl dehydratase